MIHSILNFLYPPKCISCLEITGTDEYCLCENCQEEIKSLERVCYVCGMPLNEGNACVFCSEGHYYFQQNISMFKYNDVKEMIHNFKYDRKIWIGKVIGKLLAEYLLENYPDILKMTNYIVPVPIHKKKLKFRGFNQSEIIAEEMAEVTGIALLKEGIIRNRNTMPQSLVEYGSRFQNVQDAFSVRKNVKKTNILLVDDIYTTGNTLNSISSALKEAGSGEIYCATFSISAK